MYALLLPSAQRFISRVEEKVNEEVRQIGAPTGTPTPWRIPSPAWIAFVWGPCWSEGLFFIIKPILAAPFSGASTNLVLPTRRHRTRPVPPCSRFLLLVHF